MNEDVKTTKDHEEIKEWILQRGGKPAILKGTRLEDGILNIDFPGIDLPGYGGEENLEEITWEQFFEIFDNSNLQFLYQEKYPNGKRSFFFKFFRE